MTEGLLKWRVLIGVGAAAVVPWLVLAVYWRMRAGDETTRTVHSGARALAFVLTRDGGGAGFPVGRQESGIS